VFSSGLRYGQGTDPVSISLVRAADTATLPVVDTRKTTTEHNESSTARHRAGASDQTARPDRTDGNQMPDLGQSNEIEDVTNRVSDRVDDSIPRDAVRTRVRQQFSAMQNAVITQFVPVFVERRVRAELVRLSVGINKLSSRVPADVRSGVQ